MKRNESSLCGHREEKKCKKNSFFLQILKSENPAGKTCEKKHRKRKTQDFSNEIIPGTDSDRNEIRQPGLPQNRSG
jgi:hypothetical protein